MKNLLVFLALFLLIQDSMKYAKIEAMPTTLLVVDPTATAHEWTAPQTTEMIFTTQDETTTKAETETTTKSTTTTRKKKGKKLKTKNKNKKFIR